MASPFLQGFQVGSSTASDALNRNLRLQELKSQQQLRMLQEQQIAQQLAIQMETRNLAIQEQADMAKAVSAAQQATAPFIQMPMTGQEGLGEMNPPIMEVPNPQAMTQEQAAMNFVLPVIAKYRPNAVPDFLQGVALAESRKKVEQFQPSGKQVTLPSGKTIEGIQTSPNTFTPTVDPSSAIEVDLGNGRKTTLVQTGPNTWRPVSEDIGERQKKQFERQLYIDQVKFLKDNNPKAYAELAANADIDEETGFSKIPPESLSSAAKRAGFEPATNRGMEQGVIGAENLFATAREMLPMLNNRTVGLGGAANRLLSRTGLDKVLGIKNASDATKAETFGRVFMAQVFDQLKSDGNINEPEYQAIKTASPDPAKWITTPDDVKSQMSAILQNAARVSRGNAVKMGRDITPFFLTREEIIAQAQAGKLTLEEAVQLQNNSAWKLIEALEVK